jgi:hypothetical protein
MKSEFPLQPAPVNSITAILWELGVTHKRDEWSHTDSCHALFYAGRNIGRYSAYQVSRLIEEHGLADDLPPPPQENQRGGAA